MYVRICPNLGIFGPGEFFVRWRTAIVSCAFDRQTDLHITHTHMHTLVHTQPCEVHVCVCVYVYVCVCTQVRFSELDKSNKSDSKHESKSEKKAKVAQQEVNGLREGRKGWGTHLLYFVIIILQSWSSGWIQDPPTNGRQNSTTFPTCIHVLHMIYRIRPIMKCWKLHNH